MLNWQNFDVSCASQQALFHTHPEIHSTARTCVILHNHDYSTGIGWLCARGTVFPWSICVCDGWDRIHGQSPGGEITPVMSWDQEYLSVDETKARSRCYCQTQHVAQCTCKFHISEAVVNSIFMHAVQFKKLRTPSRL